MHSYTCDENTGTSLSHARSLIKAVGVAGIESKEHPPRAADANRRSSEGAVASSPDAPTAAAGHGPILIVQDGAARAELIRLVPQDGGCSDVHVATSGPEALSLAGRTRPKLVLLDLELPPADLLLLATQVERGAVPRPRVIGLTTRSRLPMVVDGLGAILDE